jgi:hypothetical protein
VVQYAKLLNKEKNKMIEKTKRVIKNIPLQKVTHTLLCDIQNSIIQSTGNKLTFDAIIYDALKNRERSDRND